MNQMGKTLGHALRNRSLHVTFKNEPGGLHHHHHHHFYLVMQVKICGPTGTNKMGRFVKLTDILTTL